MPSVVITVKVEETAFVSVIRALRKTQGVLGIDFDLALDHKGKGLNGAPHRAPQNTTEKKPRGGLQEVILRVLFEAEGSVPQAKIVETAVAAGFKTDSVAQGLYHFRANGIVERTGPALYRLTSVARKRMADTMQQAGANGDAPLLPAPQKRKKTKKGGGTGRPALPPFLDILSKQDAPMSRQALKLAMEALGYSGITVNRQILGTIEQGYIKDAGDDRFEITAKGRKHAEQSANPQE